MKGMEFSDFMKILRNMPSFDVVEFEAEDICRSGLVKGNTLLLNLNWVFNVYS